MSGRPFELKCDVDSCAFNKDAKRCMAEKISICSTCSEPECCDETICKTFTPRNED